MSTPVASTSAHVNKPPRRRWWLFWTLLAGIALVLGPVLLLPVMVVSAFGLGAETRGVRDAILHAPEVNGGWDRFIEVRLNRTLCGLVRAVASFGDLPPEAGVAMKSLKSAEVGVYRWNGSTGDLNGLADAVFSSAALDEGDWTRVVAVVDGGDTVAVYMGNVDDPDDDVPVCVVVCDGSELVLVKLVADMRPVVDLARAKIREHGGWEFAHCAR